MDKKILAQRPGGSDLSKYDLEKCLCGDCRGCDREFTASCGDLIDELKEREALNEGTGLTVTHWMPLPEPPTEVD